MRAALVAFLLLFPTVLPADGQYRLLPGHEPWTDGLALLHTSRTEEALESFLELKKRRPDDVCGFYFPSLVYIHFDVSDLSEEQENERGRALIERGIELGQERLDAGDAGPAARYCTGALYGLRAEERLGRSKMLGAAWDARRVRRIMLDLLEDEPACIDCRFWTGSYDYYADVIPGVIKFFRTLLFFPNGDKERGLATLHEVAEHGRIDRSTAQWVLYSIYRGLENRPQPAQEALEQIHRTYPEDMDAWLVLARFLFRVAEPPDRARGIALFEDALRHAESLEGPHRERLTVRARIGLAQAYLADLRPDIAVETVLPAFGASRGDEEREMDAAWTLAGALNHAGRHAEALILLADLEKRHPGSESLPDLQERVRNFDEESSRTFGLIASAWRRGREGETAEAESAFRELLADGHSPGLVHMAWGEMYRELEQNVEAETHYRRALEAGIDRPAVLVPTAYLRLGNLADLRDDRVAAKRYYREAADSAGDHEWARHVAKHYLKQPYSGGNAMRFP